MSESERDIASKLTAMLAMAGLPALTAAAATHFDNYLSLLQRWNQRINLTALRSEDEILKRHFVESIATACSLPAGVATLLDFGSGAGFPGLPIAICRPDIAVVLAESQSKKAAFLREVVRTLGIPVEVFSGRAETMGRTFDCVILRAVDRMRDSVAAAASLVSTSGWLGLLTTEPMADRLKTVAGPGFRWNEPLRLPSAEARILILGSKN